MNDELRQSTTFALSCVLVLLLNMDLSYLKPILTNITEQVIEKRQETKKIYDEQKDVITLPNSATISLTSEVLYNMSSYVSNGPKEAVTSKKLQASQDASCRGSPSIRSP
jgi:chaperonin GroEL (HSP60 family)